MDLFAPRHLLIILVVVLLVFGTKKLKTLGSDLGGAVRGFKKAMQDGEADKTPPLPLPSASETPPAMPPVMPPVTDTPTAKPTDTQ